MSYRVLLVDDVIEIRSILKLLLEQSGLFEIVGEAGTGPEGVALAAELQPDLVVLDVEMPGPTGWEVLPELRRLAVDTDVVVLSGTPMLGAIEPSVRELAAAVFDKGLLAGGLVDEIVAVVARRVRASEPVTLLEPAESLGDDVEADASAWLAAIFEGSSDAIISQALDGTILSWNPAAERIFGYTKEEAIGRRTTMLVPPEREDEPDRLLAQVQNAERVTHFETVRVTREGRRVDVALTLSPVVDAEGLVIGASSMARDISSRRETDRALAGAVARLEAQNRQLRHSNEELDSFAFVASHDLAQPLQVAYGYLEMLKTEFGATLDPTASTWIDASAASLERMRRLVQDILEYSRTGSREAPRSEVNLKDALDDALFALGALIAERGAKVEVGDLPVVPGNMGQLSQLFQNLVANAVKFVPGEREPRVEVSAEPRPEGWLVSVIDNGPGVPEETRERVFDMFHRGRKADGAGTGLGLAIAKKVVTAHGGRIWIDAAPGDGGSAFRFVLPGQHA